MGIGRQRRVHDFRIHQFRRGTSVTLHLNPRTRRAASKTSPRNTSSGASSSSIRTSSLSHHARGRREERENGRGSETDQFDETHLVPSSIGSDRRRLHGVLQAHQPRLERAVDASVIQGEGRIEYQSLLYLPSKAPMDLFFDSGKFGLQLYVSNVLIMESCEDLLPRYLRFVKGVVDSSDLPLNISRQRLQEDRHIAQIRKWITKKIIDALSDMARDARDKYEDFWGHFGRVLKEGVGFDFGIDAGNDSGSKARLTPLLLFDSSVETGKKDHTGRIRRTHAARAEEYFLSHRRIARNDRELAHLEAFREKKIEVLFLTDPIDEMMVQALSEFDGKALKSVGKGTVALGSDEEQNQARKDLNARQVEYPGSDDAAQGQARQPRQGGPSDQPVDGFPRVPRGRRRRHESSTRTYPPDAGRHGAEAAADHGTQPRSRDRHEAEGTRRRRQGDEAIDDFAELLFGGALSGRRIGTERSGPVQPVPVQADDPQPVGRR